MSVASSDVRSGFIETSPPVRVAISSQIPEGYGIAQRVDGWNAVLPLAPRLPAQQVRRACLGGHVHALPALARAPSQSKDARRKQRNPDDLTEDVLVAMPTDASARGILRDEHVLER